MLAVQQAPRMGSSQPPSDPFLAFGLSVDPTQEPPLLDPPEPAPGAPLLSDNDNKLLSSFFEDMTADHYNMPSFGEGLNFTDTWLDLPPQFMGSATSFGQQPGPSLASPPSHGLANGLGDFQSLMPMSSSMMPPPPPPPPTLPHLEHNHTSDDVLNAAATLLQNGSAQRHTSNGTDSTYPRRTIGPPVGHLRHQPLEEFREDNRRSLGGNEVDNTFTEWVFGSQERRQPTAPPPPEYQWGSDSNFNHIQGYTTHSDKETVESITKEQLKYLECFEPSQSADNTRPSSPSHGQTAPPSRNRVAAVVKVQQEAEAPPRKRRKSRTGKEIPDDEAEEDTSTPKASRRRKPKAERSGSTSSPPVDETTGKRRKSAVNGSKSARENLSEEQKRENHIRSEQKRRTLIKEGFDDLCDLVPGLRGGGFSKSTMLSMAAEWLEELLKGNEALATQLASLEGR
ncbi:hypothetical protein G7Z17_g12566 [Cylindrodendrum hubeiense]|uniref:BHLH domain-containing protein n=1 Tax=Cylindrodendrum hubeiense TaxID=595255 RepID=A0A9P5GXF7_9HYPO|nr:hypothetical protein G7Z17_g12566 [Cylindrodendrum hubeiense]